MPTPRACLGLAAANDKLYAIGGENNVFGPGFLVLNVEEYDPTSDTWAEKGSAITLRTRFGVATINGRVYAVGGIGGAGVDEYDPAADTWTHRALLLTPRSYLGVAAINGKIYATGGV